MTESKFSLVDLGKLSKPISKLIEAVSHGIGTLYEPTKIRRKAKAQADASLIRAEADVQKQELLKRALNRFAFQEMRRQQNIENIIKIAASSLPETVSEEPVDKDWISRFFDECKDVSNIDLQNIWARLLAGEVATPGSCSRTTLTRLKDFSQNDAQLFNILCSLVWTKEGHYFIPYAYIKSIDINNYLGKYNLSYGRLLHSENLGLIHCKMDVTLPLFNGDMLIYSNLNHFCSSEHKDKEIIVKVFPLTSMGIELFSVLAIRTDWSFYYDSLILFREFYNAILMCPIELRMAFEASQNEPR